MKIRTIVSNFWLIHLFVFAGLFALIGAILGGQPWLLVLMALSFSGAVCGGFIRVIDAIQSAKK
jgi:hypothetical protein